MPIGVKTRKKTNPKITGLTAWPRRSQNLNQTLLKGPNKEGNVIVTIKKRMALAKKYHPKDFPVEICHIPTTKNTRVNTIPKERLEETLISSIISKFSCILSQSQ